MPQRKQNRIGGGGSGNLVRTQFQAPTNDPTEPRVRVRVIAGLTRKLADNDFGEKRVEAGWANRMRARAKALLRRRKANKAARVARRRSR